MTVSKPVDRRKQRKLADAHPWRGKSFEAMQAQRERLNKLAEIRRREREQVE